MLWNNPFHINTGLDSSTIRQLIVDRALRPLAGPALGYPAKVELLLCGGDSHRCYPSPEFYSTDRSLRFVRTLFGWTLGGAVPSQVSRANVSQTSQPSELKPDPEDLFRLLFRGLEGGWSSPHEENTPESSSSPISSPLRSSRQ